MNKYILFIISASLMTFTFFNGALASNQLVQSSSSSVLDDYLDEDQSGISENGNFKNSDGADIKEDAPTSLPPQDSGSEFQNVGLFENSAELNLPQFIAQSEKTVEIEIYELGDDAVVESIKEALNRGVRVRIVVEGTPVGKKSCWRKEKVIETESSCRELKELEMAMDRANRVLLKDSKLSDSEKKNKLNLIRPFDKGNLCGTNASKAREGRCYQHGKIVIVDNKRALLSTGNFNSSNLCDLTEPVEPRNCNRDYSYITRDRAVLKSLQQIFESDLSGKRPDILKILKEGGASKKLTVSPFSYEPLKDLIYSARESILIQTQYLKSDKFIKLLIAKAQKENSVQKSNAFQFQILLSDPCHFSRLSQKEQRTLRATLEQLDRAKIAIRFMTKRQKIKNKPAYLHAKAIVVDERIAWVGSTNISDSSFFQNREYGIFFRYPWRVKNLSQIMKKDFEDPGSIEWRQGLLCRKADSKS